MSADAPATPRRDQTLQRELSAAYHEADRALHGAGQRDLHLDLLRGLSRELSSRRDQDAEARAFEREFAESFIPAFERNDLVAASASFATLSRLYRPLQVEDAGNGARKQALRTGDAAPKVAHPDTSGASDVVVYFILGFVGAVLIATAVDLLKKTRKTTAASRGGPKIDDAQARAHELLDPHLDFLRGRLAAFGPPRAEGDRLFFGDYLVNGKNEIVDRVKADRGCFATIFVGDKRIATNVVFASGARALNTPLAHGPAYETVMGKKQVYAGMVLLFGRDILALYEPVMDGEKVIGILFVGL